MGCSCSACPWRHTWGRKTQQGRVDANAGSQARKPFCQKRRRHARPTPPVDDYDDVGCTEAGFVRVEFEQFDEDKEATPDSDDENCMLQRARWADLCVDRADLLVRALSGTVMYMDSGAVFDSPISDVVSDILDQTGAYDDEVRLCAGAAILDHRLRLGECVVPSKGGKVELTFVHVPGPPVSAQAASGRPIRVLETMPALPFTCYIDRGYEFISLGGFADNPNMRYVLAPNSDKATPNTQVMWRLDIRCTAVVYLNFSGERHVTDTGVADWLEEDGWQTSSLASTVSTGVPNGPYTGPVYYKAVQRGLLNLMGSNCWEGSYFVFVELGAV